MDTVAVDMTGFDGVLEDVGRDIDLALAEAMEEGADRVRNSSVYQQRTGAYAESVSAGIEGKFAGGTLVGYVRADAPHADFLEHGTAPHDIVPRNGKALRFEVGGRVVFAVRVRHPGTRALRLIEGCITQREVEARLNDAAKKG